jgi:hypothetical protein
VAGVELTIDISGQWRIAFNARSGRALVTNAHVMLCEGCEGDAHIDAAMVTTAQRDRAVDNL